jgi:hypothetical protein
MILFKRSKFEGVLRSLRAFLKSFIILLKLNAEPPLWEEKVLAEKWSLVSLDGGSWFSEIDSEG